jgi:hypothetical protein
VQQPVLREIADAQGRRPRNRTRIRLVEPGKHSEERGLSCAVRAAQTYTLAVGDLPRDSVKQDTLAEALGKRLELDHRAQAGGVRP